MVERDKISFEVVVWSRGSQQEILRKRPKNNNKAWIKLSEAILSILGDFWEKFICSSLPARLMEEFPASKVHLQRYNLQPDLLGSFPADVCPDITSQFGCDHRPKLIPLDTLNGPFPSKTFLQRTLNLPASKNWPEEQIFWGTDPLGAPVVWYYFNVFFSLSCEC